jgi:LCP family protein required for cell wall assembly
MLAAVSSAIVPGLGQLANGRLRLGLWLAIPVVLLGLIAYLVVGNVPKLALVATVVDPTILRTLLALSLGLMVWRMVAVVHAFWDRRYPALPGPLSLAVLAFALAVVAVPHAIGHWYGSAAEAAFGRFFSGEAVLATKDAPTVPPAVAPADGERLNVLLIGLDWTDRRTATLTDTMMLASIDPKLGTASLVSIPRDLIDVPLGDGNIFGLKLNALYSWAAAHPDELPQGPVRALQDAVGALLGVRVQYYAQMDFDGFVRAVDLAGGVDVHNERVIDDPRYDGLGLGHPGFKLEPGDHRLTGWEALAYVRSRQGVGDSDFTRAARQQEVLVALRERLLDGGSLFFRLPGLLQIFGDTVRTDLPPSQLPQLAAVAEAMAGDGVSRTVISGPLVKSVQRGSLGSAFVPRLDAIRQMARSVLPAPGTPATSWPQPKP